MSPDQVRPSYIEHISLLCEHIQTLGALAVDWINDKIYYSFGDYGSLEVNPNHLAVYDISTGANTEITANVNQQYAVFHDIGVDPKNR